MHSLIDGAIDKARMIVVILLSALIAGSLTYINIPKESEPEIAVPYVGVTVTLPGVSPEDSERLIVRPLETQLQTLEGLKEYTSLAAEGVGLVILEFENNFDPEQAFLDTQEKVDLAERDMPASIDAPVLQEINTALFPILVVNLYGDVPERGLNQIAQSLKNDLEALPGVLEANIRGNREEVLEILIDPLKLETYNISYQEILQAISANNQLIPAGRIDTGAGRFPVKVPSLIRAAEDAWGLPIRESDDRVITLKDVADIRRTFKDREVYGQFNGQNALGIQIVKRTGANILSTVEGVKGVIEASEEGWPDTLKVALSSDISTQIEGQFGQLQAAIMTAILLVMIIVVAALNLRSAALVGVAIPSSFVVSFLLLGAMGFTLNTMVMFGMLIAVGILVDGAIVVVEYADRKMAEGLNKVDAYRMAAKRMFWPIVASNATTLAAFVPFLFWNSLLGEFMSYLPITLIFVLTSSLIMALIFLPVLGSIFGGRGSTPDKTSRLTALSGEGAGPLEAEGWLGRYASLTRTLIRRPLMVTGGALGAIGLVFFWFSQTQHPTELFLDLEPEEVFVFVSGQGSLSAEEEFKIVSRVQDAALQVPGVRSVSMTSGNPAGEFRPFDTSGPTDTIGSLLVTLQTRIYGYNGRTAEADLRKAVEAVPGVRIEIKAREQGPPTGKDVQISVRSEDHDRLSEVAETIRQRLDNDLELREIDDTRSLPGIEYEIQVDRAEAGKYGVDVTEIGRVVQLVTNGVLSGIYRPFDALEEVEIRTRLPEAYRGVAALDTLRIATPAGQVPLSNFVTRVPKPRVSVINRRQGLREISLRANAIEQGQGAAKVEALKDWIASSGLDQGVQITFEGADEDAAEAAAFFQIAAFASLFLMAVILLWEFNNFYHVILTLMAVVLSTTGVLIGIQLFLPYISVLMIGTGIVALAGIVVNNNIVLIDTFQRLKKTGRSAEDAAIMAAAQRIRPILLTTATTICGLLPMMYQMNVNFASGTIFFGGGASEWFVQLSTAVVFGLGFSTFMALIVTPVWLALPERIARFVKKTPQRADAP